MTSAQMGGGVKNAPNLLTNSVDFADRERGGGQKMPKLCGHHIWKNPKAKFAPNITSRFRGWNDAANRMGKFADV